MSDDADMEEALEELASLCWDLEHGKKNFARIQDEEVRERKYRMILESMEKTQLKLKHVQYEIKMLDHGPAKERYEERWKELETKFVNVRPAIESLGPAKKATLLGLGVTASAMLRPQEGTALSGGSPRGSPLNPSDTTTELTKKTRHLQDDAYVRLDRTQKTLDDSIYVGTATTHQLRSQGEQLAGLSPKLAQTAANVKDANRFTRKLLRLLACDRVSIILAVLVVALLTTIVTLIVLEKNDKIRLPVSMNMRRANTDVPRRPRNR